MSNPDWDWFGSKATNYYAATKFLVQMKTARGTWETVGRHTSAAAAEECRKLMSECESRVVEDQ